MNNIMTKLLVSVGFFALIACQQTENEKIETNSQNYNIIIAKKMADFYLPNENFKYVLANYQISQLMAGNSVDEIYNTNLFDNPTIKASIFEYYSNLLQLLNDNEIDYTKVRSIVSKITEELQKLNNSDLQKSEKELSKYIDNYRISKNDIIATSTQIVYQIWNSDFSKKINELQKMKKNYNVIIDTSANSLFDPKSIRETIEEPHLNDQLTILLYKKYLKNEFSTRIDQIINNYNSLNDCFTIYYDIVVNRKNLNKEQMDKLIEQVRSL